MILPSIWDELNRVQVQDAIVLRNLSIKGIRRYLQETNLDTNVRDLQLSFQIKDNAAVKVRVKNRINSVQIVVTKTNAHETSSSQRPVG